MKYFLLILIAFVTLTALISGLLLMSIPDGSVLNLSVGVLKNTNFGDFQFPGFLIVLFVGLINLLALFYIMQHHPFRYNYALAAGIALLLWILVQFVYVSELFWLNALYTTIAIAIILMSFQLKGKTII
jgi:hypothetical protein